MLVLFEKLARRFRFLRIPALIVLSGMLALTVWVLLSAPAQDQDRWLIPVILGTVWVTMLFSSLLLFSEVPSPVAEHSGWGARLALRFKRFFYHLFAWFMMLVSVALVVVTFQLTMAWLRMQ